MKPYLVKRRKNKNKGAWKEVAKLRRPLLTFKGVGWDMEFKIFLALCGTAVSFLFGTWDTSLTILIVFMVIDFLTGIAKGAYFGKLRSSIGYKGMLRKSVIMLVIILANMLDMLVGQEPIFRTMAVYFYVSNEGLSIIENLGEMGVPFPKAIKRYIEQLNKEKSEEDDDSLNNKKSNVQ